MGTPGAAARAVAGGGEVMGDKAVSRSFPRLPPSISVSSLQRLLKTHCKVRQQVGTWTSVGMKILADKDKC